MCKRQVLELYNDVRPSMVAYLHSLGLVESDAGDVIQETFLRLMTHLAARRPEGNLRAWLFQVAYCQAMDLHRLDKRFSSLSDDGEDAKHWQRDIADASPTPEEIAIEAEKVKRFLEALESLPAQQRKCVVLRSEGLRYREIAVSLGVSTQRAAILVERGVSRLAAIM